MVMNKFGQVLVLLGLVFSSSLASAQPGPATCCYTCTCAFCGDLETCAGPTLVPSECDPDGTSVCGVGTGTLCSEFWENNTEGVSSNGSQPNDPNGCIPIDGGLGFLIAGGLGMGVIGIRRRKEDGELKRV